MLIGGLVLAYGMVILAPLVPTAAWSGVVDSVTMGPPKGPQFPGRTTRSAMTLFLRGQPNGRTFSLPAASTLTGESIKTGDTVRASVGWASFREMPAAVNLVHSGNSLIDSAVVLREQRTQRSRVSLAGGVVLVLGLVAMLRSARKQ
jgi:hypothetical protein